MSINKPFKIFYSLDHSKNFISVCTYHIFVEACHCVLYQKAIWLLVLLGWSVDLRLGFLLKKITKSGALLLLIHQEVGTNFARVCIVWGRCWMWLVSLGSFWRNREKALIRLIVSKHVTSFRSVYPKEEKEKNNVF